MQRTYTSALVAAIVTLAAGQAMAQQTQTAPLTREQVRAELIEAQRTGDIVEYETGKKLNQLFPSRYPTQAAEAAPAVHAPQAEQAAPQGKTRAQVQAEFAEARRTGDIVEYETGKKLNQLFPSRYPTKLGSSAPTVAQGQAGNSQF